MTDNPDLAELIRYNREGCKHEQMQESTRYIGGTPGRIGSYRQERWWWCQDCKQHVRPWSQWTDTAEGRELIEKLEKMHVEKP